MSEVKSLLASKKALEREIRNKQKEKLYALLDGVTVDEGYRLEEITSKVLEKAYVTEKDKRKVYMLLTSIRRESDGCLAYRNKKYGWADDKETIDSYRLANIHNGLKKVRYNIDLLPKNYKAIGVRSNPMKMIESNIKQFGVELKEVESQ